MSVLGALFSGVSGLGAESQALSVISDNIANSNTTAFKETTTHFSTLVTASSNGAGAFQPGGVVAHAAAQISQQGLLQSTSSATDLAISGGGFFVVNNTANDTGAFTFTRAGGFIVDANGNLKNGDGFFLQGQKLTQQEAAQIAAGNTNQLTATALDTLQTVNVNGLSGSAKATANITLAANLPAADTAAGTTPPTGTPRTMTVPVFDSQGTEHDLTLNFSRVPPVASTETIAVSGGALGAGDALTLKFDNQTLTFNSTGTTSAALAGDVSAALAAANITGFTVAAGAGTSVVITDPSGNAFQPSDAITDAAGATFTTTPANGTTNANQWTASATIAGGVIAPLGANNKVVFNTDGTLSAATTLSSIQISSWTSGGATAPQTLNLNLGTPTQANGLTQFGSAFAVSEVNQDGLHFGNYTGVTIDQVGIVTANFDNGLKQPIYLIPIATFPNPNALDAQSGNVYLQTNDSGTFLLRQAGQGAAGQIAPSSLENSTVDIAQEFSNLIITQRAYEANTKIITTADQMLQSLINAKQ